MAESERYTAVPGSERTPLPGTREIGPVDPNEEIQVSVLVRRRPGSSLGDLVDQMAVQPPGQRRYLKPEALASQYGADPADLSTVAEGAGRHGLSLVEMNRLKRTVVLKGRLGEISSAFRVNLSICQGPTGTFR